MSAGFGLLAGPASFAQQPRSLADPLRVGVDLSLGGLAKAWQRAFGLDTGIAVHLVAGPALLLLESLERGELDASLTNAPQAEARLVQLGLAHDPRPVAAGQFVLVGPAPSVQAGDPAMIAGLRSAAEALTRIRDAALSLPGAVTFLSAGDGSGNHLAEQALWRQARIAPALPWYASASPGADHLAQTRARHAYALVEKGLWSGQGGSPLAVLVEGDPAMAETVTLLRAFRVKHPAGKIFVDWIAGPKGRRVLATQTAYRHI